MITPKSRIVDLVKLLNNHYGPSMSLYSHYSFSHPHKKLGSISSVLERVKAKPLLLVV